MTILKHNPRTRSHRLMDQLDGDDALALAQRNRAHLVGHALVDGELVQVHERIDARRQEKHEWRLSYRVAERGGQVKRGRINEFGAHLIDDELFDGI